MSVSNIVMYLLPVFITPILSRLYGPDSFGEWGIFSSVISIVTIGILGGYENIIMKVPEKDIVNAYCLSFFVGLFGIIVVTILLCCPPLNNLLIKKPYLLYLFVLYFVLYILYVLSFNILNRYELYNKLALCSIILGGAQAVFRIYFGISKCVEFNGLILGTIIAEGVLVFYLLYQLKKMKEFHCVKLDIHWTRMKALMVKYKKFPLYDAPSNILSFAAFNLPIIILSYYFDNESIGCYSIILQLLLMPMSLVGSAIGKVYYQQLCKNFEKAQYISFLTRKTLNISAIISILPMFFIVCGGDCIIVLFLGDKWGTAGYVALCLSLWSFPTILTQPLLPLFRVTNTQNKLLVYDILYFVSGIVSILVCCKMVKNLYVVLTTYSVVCAIIKFMLFFKILSLSSLSIKNFYKYIPFWLVVIGILFFRLMNL